MQRFNRERCVWVLLNHPNVLPCYGITYDINRRPSLISPYCREGDASKYLKKHPNADRMAIVRRIYTVPRPSLIAVFQVKGIAAGLKYLHSQNVVHGDLKLVSSSALDLNPTRTTAHVLPFQRNVVIDVDNSIVTPRICDFGRSEIRDTTGFTTWSAIGTTVYMAPEFLEGCDGSQDHNPEAQKPMIKLTFEMDVYSFAMVTLEVCHASSICSKWAANLVLFAEWISVQILSGKTPLFDMNRYKVGMAVMDGQRPMFYKHNCPSLTPGMRALIDQCWLHTPAQRLKMPEIVRRLGAGL
jgi:serine/threonine protein kinase